MYREKIVVSVLRWYKESYEIINIMMNNLVLIYLLWIFVCIKKNMKKKIEYRMDIELEYVLYRKII